MTSEYNEAVDKIRDDPDLGSRFTVGIHPEGGIVVQWQGDQAQLRLVDDVVGRHFSYRLKRSNVDELSEDEFDQTQLLWVHYTA